MVSLVARYTPKSLHNYGISIRESSCGRLFSDDSGQLRFFFFFLREIKLINQGILSEQKESGQ